MEESHLYTHLLLAAGLRANTIKRLREIFVSDKNIWTKADAASFNKAMVPPEQNKQWSKTRPSQNPKTENARLAREGIALLGPRHKHFPKQLLELPDPPVLLYTRGQTKHLQTNMLAVVGARKVSGYGTQAVRLVARALAPHCTIVSGLALGTDALAHDQAVQQSRPTVAVVGSGTDRQSLYPASNYPLAKRIMQNGCLVSEQPPGYRPLPFDFPKRNRLIATLASATVIGQAGIKSGSLITATQALERGHDVYAIPGPITDKAWEGSNKLIFDGASPIYSLPVFLQQLGFTQNAKQTLKSANPCEQFILQLLTDRPMKVDSILRLSTFDATTTLSAMTTLEISGRVAKQANTLQLDTSF